MLSYFTEKNIFCLLKLKVEQVGTVRLGRAWLARGLSREEADRLFDAPMNEDREVVTQWGNTPMQISSDEETYSTIPTVVEELCESDQVSETYGESSSEQDGERVHEVTSTASNMSPAVVKVCTLDGLKLLLYLFRLTYVSNKTNCR